MNFKNFKKYFDFEKFLNIQKVDLSASKFYKYFICIAESFEIKLWQLTLHPWICKHSSPRDSTALGAPSPHLRQMAQ